MAVVGVAEGAGGWLFGGFDGGAEAVVGCFGGVVEKFVAFFAEAVVGWFTEGFGVRCVDALDVVVVVHEEDVVVAGVGGGLPGEGCEVLCGGLLVCCGGVGEDDGDAGLSVVVGGGYGADLEGEGVVVVGVGGGEGGFCAGEGGVGVVGEFWDVEVCFG